MTQQEKESWTPILGRWGKLYEVSTLGKVRRISDGLILKASSSGKNGRLQLKLRDIGGAEHTNVMLSHIILSSFHNEEISGRKVAYRDGNSANCALNNLYFVDCTHPTSKYGNSGGGKKKPDAVTTDFAAALFAELIPETQKLLRTQLNRIHQ